MGNGYQVTHIPGSPPGYLVEPAKNSNYTHNGYNNGYNGYQSGVAQSSSPSSSFANHVDRDYQYALSLANEEGYSQQQSPQGNQPVNTYKQPPIPYPNTYNTNQSHIPPEYPNPYAPNPYAGANTQGQAMYDSTYNPNVLNRQKSKKKSNPSCTVS